MTTTTNPYTYSYYTRAIDNDVFEWVDENAIDRTATRMYEEFRIADKIQKEVSRQLKDFYSKVYDENQTIDVDALKRYIDSLI